jgi:hypothetical protein
MIAFLFGFLAGMLFCDGVKELRAGMPGAWKSLAGSVALLLVGIVIAVVQL